MTRARESGKGFILIWVLIVLISMTLMATAFVYLKSAQIRGAGQDIASSQALWLAEAGVQQVMYRLWSDAAYRASPTAVSGNLGRGSFLVTVSKNVNNYTATSVGSVLGLTRTVRRTLIVGAGALTWPAAFSYAVFGNTNSSTLQLLNTATITGDLYYGGNVSVAVGATVTGLVYANQVTGAGHYTQAPGPPNPVPAYPVIDTTSYDNLITTAQSVTRSNLNLSGTSVLNLSGGTQYYRVLTVQQSAQVNGPGTLVMTNGVTIRDNAIINSNVMIITPSTLNIQNSAQTMSGVTLYSRANMTISDNASVKGSAIVPVAGHRLILSNAAVFQGAVYADEVRFSGSPDNVVFSGSIVANQYYQDRINGNAQIAFNSLDMPASAPTGLGVPSVVVTPQKDWQEI